MKVGKYLLEKHNFGDEEVKSRFLDQFGYSERILESILDDRYQALLTCHLHDLSIFTGEDIDFLNSLQEFDKLTDFEKQTLNSVPLGKPYQSLPTPFVTLPVKTEINVKDKEPRSGIELKLNLNDPDKPVEMYPVDEEGIRRYEEAMDRLRGIWDTTPFSKAIGSDPEMDALFARIREYSKGKTFKVITPSEVKPGSQVPSDPSEIDYVVTTYPITGPQSVKIVKGRELGIGTGDKFVFANQMRSTINKLGLSNPPPEEVDVLLGNSRIAALMEDPEFRAQWKGVVGERLVQLAKDQIARELVGENGHHPDKMLKGTIDVEGIDIYTQPSLRVPDTEVSSELDKEILPPRQTGCRGADMMALYYKDNDQPRSDYKLSDVVEQELVSVPKGLLRELANIAIDNGYPCAEEAFQLLTKNK